MKRYILTSKKFIGQIFLAFNNRGTVAAVDMTTAELDAHSTGHFLRSIPVLESNLAKSFSSEVTIVAEDFQVSFDDFWNSYDKKINKKRCIPLWNKLNLNQQVAAYYGIRKYDAFLKASNRIKCDPENYIRNEMWENEYK